MAKSVVAGMVLPGSGSKEQEDDDDDGGGTGSSGIFPCNSC